MQYQITHICIKCFCLFLTLVNIVKYKYANTLHSMEEKEMKISTYKGIEYRKSKTIVNSFKRVNYKTVPCKKNLYEYKYIDADGIEHWRKIDTTSVREVKIFIDSILKGDAVVMIPIHY